MLPPAAGLPVLLLAVLTSNFIVTTGRELPAPGTEKPELPPNKVSFSIPQFVRTVLTRTKMRTPSIDNRRIWRGARRRQRRPRPRKSKNRPRRRLRRRPLPRRRSRKIARRRRTPPSTILFSFLPGNYRPLDPPPCSPGIYNLEKSYDMDRKVYYFLEYSSNMDRTIHICTICQKIMDRMVHI